MSVANEGEFRLEWQAYAVSYNDTVARNTALYTLSDAVPAKSPSEADGKRHPAGGRSVTANCSISRDCASCTTDRTSSRGNTRLWRRTFAGGASVIENTAPKHARCSKPPTSSGSSTERALAVLELYAISDWVRSGGALLLQGTNRTPISTPSWPCGFRYQGVRWRRETRSDRQIIPHARRRASIACGCPDRRTTSAKSPPETSSSFGTQRRRNGAASDTSGDAWW